MIAFLSGKVKDLMTDYLILDVSGVGYRIELGEDVLKYEKGKEASFYIYTHVRESELRLFGFPRIEDLALFEKLIDVSGVGPKAGLSLITTLGKDKIVQAILKKEPRSLKVPGVGQKTANKIILELTDKLKKEGYNVRSYEQKDFLRSAKYKDKLDEAQEALKSLGYSQRDVERLFSKINESDEVHTMESSEFIKYLLSLT